MKDFIDAFSFAQEKEKKEEDIHVHDEADFYLEKIGITRVFAESISTNVI